MKKIFFYTLVAQIQCILLCVTLYGDNSPASLSSIKQQMQKSPAALEDLIMQTQFLQMEALNDQIKLKLMKIQENKKILMAELKKLQLLKDKHTSLVNKYNNKSLVNKDNNASKNDKKIKKQELKVDRIKKECSTLTDKIKKLRIKKKSENNKSKLSEITIRIKTLVDKLNIVKTKLNANENTLEKLKKEQEENRNEIKQNKSEIAALEKQIQQQQEVINKLNSKAKINGTEINILVSKYNTIHQKMSNSLKSMKDTKNSVIKNLK